MYLVTITGTAGVGKTSLALSVGALLSEAFPDGIFLISLGELHSVQLVLPALAKALCIQTEHDQPLVETLQAGLRERHCLLLLDNLEQVIESVSLLEQTFAVLHHQGGFLVQKPHREEIHTFLPAHLTRREIEVLRLMTTRLTNPQIAVIQTMCFWPVILYTSYRTSHCLKEITGERW